MPQGYRARVFCGVAMLIATRNGIRNAEPEPKTRASCPLCEAPVIAKCGRIVVWHWAHETRADCDPWAETPGQWHREWQESVSAAQREVIIGKHRADILTSGGWAVELQDSNLSPDEIQEREHYYTQRTTGMLWVFNAEDAYASGRLNLRPRTVKCPQCRCAVPRNYTNPDLWYCRCPHHTNPVEFTYPDPFLDSYRSFRWKQQRKSLMFCRQPVFLDLGRVGRGALLRLTRFYKDGPPYGGFGSLIDKTNFQEALVNSKGGVAND